MKPGIFIGMALGWGLATAALAGVPLQIDAAQSRVDVEVNATAGSFVGQLANYEAVVTVDPVAKRIEKAVVTFDFNDVKTGDEKRDRHMHDWQDTKTFPAGKFVLTSLANNAEGRLVATGDLTLHGQTHAVTFPVSVLSDAHSMAVDGRVEVDTREFGLPIIRKFVVLKVDPLVVIDFHLQGSLPAAP